MLKVTPAYGMFRPLPLISVPGEITLEGELNPVDPMVAKIVSKKGSTFFERNPPAFKSMEGDASPLRLADEDGDDGRGNDSRDGYGDDSYGDGGYGDGGYGDDGYGDDDYRDDDYGDDGYDGYDERVDGAETQTGAS